ncbi:MAG: hypothetical protein IJS19_02205 [Muribaculaceae bacterium]|nr:hypothetical protein [Muribaculaceae bacterium]
MKQNYLKTLLLSFAITVLTAGNVVNSAEISNASRVMRGTATAINGATVGVVGNTAWSVTNATGGNAVVRYWTLVDDNGTACTTGTATLGQTPGNTY